MKLRIRILKKWPGCGNFYTITCLVAPVDGGDKHEGLAPHQLQLEEGVDQDKLLLLLQLDHVLTESRIRVSQS